MARVADQLEIIRAGGRQVGREVGAEPAAGDFLVVLADAVTSAVRGGRGDAVELEPLAGRAVDPVGGQLIARVQRARDRGGPRLAEHDGDAVDRHRRIGKEQTRFEALEEDLRARMPFATDGCTPAPETPAPAAGLLPRRFPDDVHENPPSAARGGDLLDSAVLGIMTREGPSVSAGRIGEADCVVPTTVVRLESQFSGRVVWSARSGDPLCQPENGHLVLGSVRASDDLSRSPAVVAHAGESLIGDDSEERSVRRYGKSMQACQTGSMPIAERLIRPIIGLASIWQVTASQEWYHLPVMPPPQSATCTPARKCDRGRRHRCGGAKLLDRGPTRPHLSPIARRGAGRSSD